MDDPDAWWDHIPVIIAPTREPIPEFAEKLKSAIDVIKERRPDALAVVPTDGFRIVACAYMAVVGLYLEDSSLPWMKLRPFETPEGIVWRRNHDTGDEIEVDYLELVERFADSLARKWPHWLEWRKRRRRKPVPAWLEKMRAEEREEKRQRLRLASMAALSSKERRLQVAICCLAFGHRPSVVLNLK